MKKLACFLLLLAVQAQAQIFEQGRSATMFVHFRFNDHNIASATLTETQVNGLFARPDGTVVNVTCTTTGDRRLQNNQLGSYGISILPTDFNQVGVYGGVISASNSIDNPLRITVVSPAENSIAARIASATAMLAGLVVPASGMSRPAVWGTIEGDNARNLWFCGDSQSSATPTIDFEFTDTTTGGTLYYDESALTYSVLSLSNGYYQHRYKLAIPDSMPNQWYKGVFRCQADGFWYAVPFSLIKEASPSIETGDFLTVGDFNTAHSAVINGMTAWFRQVSSGHPHLPTVYYASSVLERAQAGVSSAYVRHVTRYQPYGSTQSVYDPIADSTAEFHFVYDYPEQTDTRNAKAYPIPVSPVVWAASESVSIYTAGSE